jgi:hypothetical protein
MSMRRAIVIVLLKKYFPGAYRRYDPEEYRESG